MGLMYLSISPCSLWGFEFISIFARNFKMLELWQQTSLEHQKE